MFGKGKAYPELGGERGMGQGWYGAIGKLAIAALLIGAVLIWRPDAACESQSRSTYENAVLTKKALEASHPRSVMLVTSWFHSRRALAVFRDVWPEVTFGVHPVYAGATFTARFRIYEMGYIFSEYVKTLWYMVRYGIA